MQLAKISAIAGVMLSLAAGAALAAPSNSQNASNTSNGHQSDLVTQCSSALAGVANPATGQVEHLTANERAYCQSVVRQ